MNHLEADLRKLALSAGQMRLAPDPIAAADRQQGNYINLTPAGVAGRDGRIVGAGVGGGGGRRFVVATAAAANPRQTSSGSPSSSSSLARRRLAAAAASPSSTPPSQPRQQQSRAPAIPQSQQVKNMMSEPSYSTILQTDVSSGSASSLYYRPPAAAETLPALLRPEQPQQQVQQQQQPLYVNLDEYSPADPASAIYQQYYASPPSPVSSSYSELRQATRYPPGYHLQQMLQQQQQSYESLYEPIQQQQQQPAPGLSQRQVLAAAAAAAGDPVGSSSSDSPSSDFFGMCSKCAGRIVGEGSGCEALGRRYHVGCFTCHQCACRLQGKPFYPLYGKPYCRDCYQTTFERCCKCLESITERILRATGKPYHPECFTCRVCRGSLDGVPFTVDATNQIHCIPCFHKRFAPKCSVCREPIMPEGGQEETVRVVALDRSFHVDCYRCEDCGLVLSSDEESGCYPLDGHVLCKNCNTRRIQDLTFGIK